jgi:hypothetical protein
VSNSEQLTKVYIDLSGDLLGRSGMGGESFWAKPHGNDHYELRNSPFEARNLNFLDVVRAVPDAPGEKPRILEVVRRSGHRTIWVTFPGSSNTHEPANLLKELNRLHAFYEGASDYFFAVDVEPEGDYQAVCEQLSIWEQQGILEFESNTTNYS